PRRPPPPPPPARPAGPFPAGRQRRLCERVAEVLGFDFTHGRLDVSLHPFCSGNPDDIRITTRYDEADYLSSMMSVIHETGHALYTRGLPECWTTQPVGRPRGTGIDESQSLLMEVQACRTPEFLSFAAPLIAGILAEEGAPGWDADTLRGQMLRVKPDFIRVDADEVTYPAHVILRYRLEKALVAGDLDVAGLPSAWNEGMEDLLGIRPPDDRLGCLQDIHWYCGLIGYFPTYTLGAMTAAQLFDAAKRSVPGLLEAIGRGDFRPLLGWLRTHVHSRGSLIGTDELLTAATGRPLDSAVFKSHLTNRYLS
ncbi:MAG: carboxypeptidase M32, partial [Telmatospirillum sp.]|nr:carboxypeptidase M32 [Telmatospirillum sp.]